MAEIYIDDLIEVIKLHRSYSTIWENGVPAEQALYIRFNRERTNVLPTKENLLDGRLLVIDRRKDDDSINGIEIIG